MTGDPIARIARATALAAAVLPLLAGPLAGQTADTARAAPTAALVTIGQGDAVWERFGHNLIWIRDRAAGTSEAYNYGLFSFEQESFVLRFVRGHMRYWMAGFDARRMMRAYASQDRSVWIQELNLTSAQVRELHAFLERNARPENRFYRYHYYRDNCSTRVRDALDRVLDGRLRDETDRELTSLTYRDHTLRLTWGNAFGHHGLHFGMGPPTDLPLTPWQAAFVPMELMDQLRGIAVPDPEGGTRPLVAEERTFYEADRPPVPTTTPRHGGGFLLGGLLVAALFWALGRWGRESRAGHILLGFAGIPWLLAVGVFGSMLLFMWGCTDHVDAHGNANLFHANPVHLALAALLPFALGGGGWAGRWVRRCALAAAGLSLLGLACEIVPFPDQVNGEWVALLLPANLALARVLWTAPEVPDDR